MGRLPADHEVRRTALDPARSFIVQAPAGSGKTGLLTQRFLVLLSVVEAPEEIVAITFTRKAAGEMRHRILGALQQAASGDLPEDPYEQETRELALQALARDREQGWDLLHNPARLRVRTIDSFCQYLAGQGPLLSGLGGGTGVTEDARELHEEAARSVLEELESRGRVGDALALLLRHRNNDSERLIELLADMLARRDQWLRHLGRGDSRQLLESALEVAVEKGLADAWRALEPFASKLLPLLRFAADNLPAESPLAPCRDLTELPPPHAGNLPRWRGIAELLLTQKNEWRKSVNRNIGFPAGCDEKAEMLDLLETLRGRDDLREPLAGIRTLPHASYTDTDWQVLDALLEVLQHTVAHLQLAFAARGKVDFAEVMLRALRALGGREGPTDLALKLDYRIRHLLVDEFQDTSRNQYELFEALTAGWQPGEGRSLFLVGDPMQSIYRFREAEVGLFLQAREQGIGDLPLEPLALEVNFRSSRGIVEWVNASFPRILARHDDPFEGAVAYAPSEAYRPTGVEPAVEVHPFARRADEPEARLVVELVQRSLAEDAEGTLAILVRNRVHAADITRELNRAGIGFQAVEMEALSARPVVRDLMALTLALLYPADRISWLALLRSPLCGLRLQDLHTLAAGDPRTLPQLLMDGQHCAALSADARQRLARAWPLLEAALLESGRKPLRTRIEGTWLALGGPATLENDTELEDAEVFLMLLQSLEADGSPVTREALARGMEKLHALPDSSGTRVQIMTMHKAKGLEFDTVILPGLGRTPRGEESRLLYWLETLDDQGNEQLILAPMKSAADREEKPAARYIRELEKRKRLHEDGRLLYVAATRARKKLHLLGHASLDSKGEVRPASSSLLARLWPAVSHHWEGLETPREDAAEAPVESPSRPLRRLAGHWRCPPPPDSIATEPAMEENEAGRGVEFDWAGDLVRVVGVVTHRLLQQIALQGRVADGFSPYGAVTATLLRREGVGEARLGEAAAMVRTAIENTLASPRGRWILRQDHREARCELPLTALLEGGIRHLVVDRTFIDEEGTRWIIDYKTGRHEGTDVEAFLDQEQERYRAQLEDYARAFRLLEPNPIRVALYYPMMDGWREWVPAG